MLLYLLNRAMWILLLAALLAGGIWLTEIDRQVRHAALEDYCGSVAIWMAEEARDVRPEHRTGHPDYDDRAAEDCPGLRPAGPAVDLGTQRQLASD